MRRSPSVITALLTLVLASSAHAAPQELMPGVTYDKQVVFGAYGPVVAHVLTAPRPGGQWGLRAVLSNESVNGRERVTDMQKRLSPSATVAGINGDLFNSTTGNPTGFVMRNGVIDHPPLSTRSAIGVDSSGGLHVDRVALLATWQGGGPRRALNDVNGIPGANGVALFTPSWGTASPPISNSVAVVLQPMPRLTPNVEHAARVVQVGTGAVPIPPDGAVLVARGTAGTRLQQEGNVGITMKLRLILRPQWTGVVDAIGGGPALVRDGRAVFRSGEEFTPAQLFPRNPRSAVGQTRDGRIVLVAVDGRRPGYSGGITNFELALLLIRLGAVTASALDGGGSVTMAFEGQLLNRPSDGPERAVAEGLFVTYAGVYAPAPLEDVLSPNGDGVDERQRLAYKVVRPSNVTASLIGPDGVARFNASGPVQPGTYPLDWTGLKPEGGPEAEGRWRWSVTAVDDRGESTQVERTFTLNNTLGFGKPVAPALAVPRPEPRAVARFQLTRAATVTPRIETQSGVVLQTLPRVRAAAGELTVEWDGRTSTGAVVYAGRYVARAVAQNELGPATLGTAFTVRRIAPKPEKPAKPAKPKS